MRRIVSLIVVGAVALTALVLGGWHWHQASASPSTPRYAPQPGGEGEEFALMDAYWNDRLTYPTGHFNPAWLRRAARQDARIPRRVPDGADGPQGANWIALGPQPERMDGCTGCFNYHKTEGRINAIVVDPTTTTNGSIVAYAATVGGGV